FKADKSHEYREAVTNSFKKISSGKEVMVIEGANSLGAASFINLQPPALAESLRAKVIMVVKPSDDNVVDEITMAGEYFSRWGVGLYGVVFNLASEQAERRVNDLMAPYLTRLSIKNLGVILENREMKAPTVGEVQEALHGKILAGDEGLGNRIGEVFVGAMSIENAIKYFRKSVNKIVVIGGDRTDIALAAMETGASAIVFTGGIHPSMKLMPRADEAKTPLILVPYDTYTTLQLINQVVSKLQPTNERWIGLLKETFWKRMRWDEIFRG
ncbi:MAG: DRTGG domain-containing protein, partial [Candidatus Bathyarchaeia archaeon]